MQKKGLEPSWYCYHTDLNRARLPIPPLLRFDVSVVSLYLIDKTYYSIGIWICQHIFEFLQKIFLFKKFKKGFTKRITYAIL